MSYNSFFYGLVTLSVTLSLNYLAKATSKGGVKNEQGQYLLHVHKLYYFTGICSLVLAAVFVVGPFMIEENDLTLYILSFLMVLLFGGLGSLCVLYFKRHYVLFDEVKVEVGSPLGRIKTLNWDEIVKGSFNFTSGLLTLTSKTGERIKVHYHLVGFPQFVELLENHTSLRAKELKLPIQIK